MRQNESTLQPDFSLIHDNPYTGILTLDRQLRINSWNRALAQWFQVTAEEIQGCSIEDVLTDIGKEKLSELTNPPLTQYEPVTAFLTIPASTGTNFHVQSAPIKNDDGNTQGIQIIFIPCENDIGNFSPNDEANYNEFIQPIIDQFAEGLFVVDQDGRFIRVNRAARDLLSYTEDDFSRLRFSDLIHHEEKDANPLAVIGNTHDQPWISEFRLLTKYNKTLHVQSSAQLLDSGYIQIVGRDISARKHTEEKLRSSEAQYRLLFESNPEPIILFDVNTLQIINANHAATQLYGYSSEEMNSLSIEQLRPSEEADKLYCFPGKVGDNDYRMGVWTHCRKDGTLFHAEITAYTVTIDDRKMRITMIQDVTETVQAEQNLRESEEKFKALTENSLVGVFMLSGQTYEYVNPKMAQILGYEPDELMGHTGPNDVLHPDDWPDVQDKIDKLLSGQSKSVEHEACFYDKGNNVRTALVYASTIHLNDQLSILGTFIDITDRKKAEEGLIYNETLLQNVFTHSQDALFLARAEDIKIEDCNPKAVEMFDMESKNELEGISIFRLRADEVSEREIQNTKAQLETGGYRADDYLLETKNNKQFWGSIVMKRFSIQERTLALVRITDIDEKMRNKQMLLEEQQFVEAITQNTPNIIQLYDVQNDSYIYANRNLQEFLGYTTQELNKFENGVIDLFAREDVPALQRRLQENLEMEDGQVQTTEFRIQHKDGHWVWLLAYDTLFKRDEEGNVQQILGTLQEITERKNAELKLANFNEELEKEVQERTQELLNANKELEAFNYTVSHDLRNPLRAIDIFSSFLEKKYYETIDDKGKQYIDQIRTGVRNITQLLDDLLAFSRIGRKEKTNEEFSMTELFQEVIQENKYYYDDNPNPHIELNDLPNVIGDRQMMRHVAINLIANAMKFTKYEDNPTITIDSYKEDDRIVFYVSDNGIGFDMTYVDKIFGVFERLHTSNEFEGTGGGLSIVERVIQRHNGSVWAEGEKGKGATIYFFLPANVSG